MARGTFVSSLPFLRGVCELREYFRCVCFPGRREPLKQRPFSSVLMRSHAEEVKKKAVSSLFPLDEDPARTKALCTEPVPPGSRTALGTDARWDPSTEPRLTGGSAFEVRNPAGRSAELQSSEAELERLGRRSKIANHVPFRVRRTGQGSVLSGRVVFFLTSTCSGWAAIGGEAGLPVPCEFQLGKALAATALPSSRE